MGDAFSQLSDSQFRQLDIQFGLAEKHHLQQLVLICFEVTQQTYLLERLDRHALRFFDKNHDLAVASVLAQ